MLDQSSPLVYSSTQIEGKNSFALKRLRRALIECELRPGSNVSEPEIAARFGLGRAAVRNALAQLAVDGLIAALPRNGWLVAPISGATIGNIVNARLMLEPQLAQSIFKPAEIAKLRELSVQLSALSERAEAEAIAAGRIIDRKLIMSVAANSGALVSKWMNEGLDSSARLLAYFEGKKVRYTAPSRENLIDALSANNSAAAAAELRAEVLRFKDYLVDQLLRSETIRSAIPGDSGSMTEHLPSAALRATTNKQNSRQDSKKEEQ